MLRFFCFYRSAIKNSALMLERQKQRNVFAESLENRRFLSASVNLVTQFSATDFSPPTEPLAVDAAGNLYGCTPNGGTFGDGTVFRVNPNNHAVWTLAAFNGQDGNSPNGVVRGAAGNLYGTTFLGGKYGDGTVFEIAAGSNKLITLVTFNGTNGANPEGNLTLDQAGNLFGENWGSQPGSFFEIKAGTGKLTMLVTFSSTQFFNVSDVTLDGQGNLYALAGAGNGDSALLKVNVTSKKLTDQILPNLSSLGNLIIDSSGNIFGTSTFGGMFNSGAIFKIPAGTGNIVTLASFDGGLSNGIEPLNLTMDAAGNLFGAALSPSTSGEFFKYDAHSGVLTDAVDVTPFTVPSTGLVADSAGNLYGMGYALSPENLVIYKASGVGFVAPTIHVSSPVNQVAAVNIAKSFSLGSFTGIDTAGPYSVVVNWGDGSQINKMNLSQTGTIPSLGHRMHEKGTFNVVVTVSDAVGHTAVSAFKIEVS